MPRQTNHSYFFIYSLAMFFFSAVVGLTLGWILWGSQVQAVIPASSTNPSHNGCQAKKGYYTVISLDKQGKETCGFARKLYQYVQETQE